MIHTMAVVLMCFLQFGCKLFPVAETNLYTLRLLRLTN